MDSGGAKHVSKQHTGNRIGTRALAVCSRSRGTHKVAFAVHGDERLPRLERNLAH